MIPWCLGLLLSVITMAQQNPRLELDAVRSPDGHKLILSVTNTSDQPLPFRFNSGQTYDFIIVNPATGREVWKWSRERFFTQAIRNENLPAKSSWKFEVEWNHLDDDSKPVSPGNYRVTAVLTSQPPLAPDPIALKID